LSVKNLKPSKVINIYEIIENLTKKGLSHRDIVKLIQIRTHPQMSLKAIKNILNAIKRLERDIIYNEKRFKKE